MTGEMIRSITASIGLLTLALSAPIAVPSALAANDSAHAAAGGSRATRWMAETMGYSPRKPLFRAQAKLESLPREEPWSSSMEKELGRFFGELATLSVFHIECRNLMCEVLLEGGHAANADRRWWDSLFELKRTNWYRANFRKDTGSTILFVQVGDKAKRRDEALKWGAQWIFLRRDVRTDLLNDKELDEQSLLPKIGGN
jgi:hypothetical protein